MKLILIIILTISLIPLTYGQKHIVQKNLSGFDFSKIQQRLNEFENLEQLEVITNQEPDSLKNKVWRKIVDDIKQTNGQIQLGYSYGLNTIYSDTLRGIASNFNTSGIMQTGLFGLPVSVSFQYNTIGIPLGTSNYFRISFDKNRYVEQQKNKINEQIQSLEQISSGLLNKKGDLTSIQNYTEIYLETLRNKIRTKGLQERKHPLTIDSLQPKVSLDTTSLTNRIDSLNHLSKKQFSTKDMYQNEYDSIMRVYERIMKYQNMCDSLLNFYQQTKNKLELIKNDYQLDQVINQNKVQQKNIHFIHAIRKIDVGLTYPKTTALSSQSTPIKGFGTEFQINQFYLALSSGLTLNNIMLSTNEIDNQLNYSQNVFNHFDFQRILSNSILTTVKAGWGTPETNHIFIGISHLSSRLIKPSTTDDLLQPGPAASFELDLRYVPRFINGSSLDFVYGKTSSNKLIDSTEKRNVLGSLFSNYRSNTFLARYTQRINKLKTEFSLTYRFIDVLANTHIYGMMQPGNSRVSFESTHRVTSWLRIGTNLKRDESIGSKKNYRIHSIGGNLLGQFTNYFAYSALINYVTFSLGDKEQIYQNGSSYLLGLTCQSNYTIQRVKLGTNVSYNDYLITDTANIAKFSQIGIAETIGEQRWSTTVKYDYFLQRTQEINSGTHVFGVGFKYKIRRLKLDASICIAQNSFTNTTAGGHLELKYQLYKFLDLQIRAERFVMGNFYRTYYRSVYERFPYLVSINLFFKF